MNQEQFTHFLFQGLGRPYLWLQEHDSTPYTDTLLHACLYNPVYDRQCEGSRAPYLYELIQLTNQPAWFRQQLLAALADPDQEMDLEQLFDFALLYARAGDATARRVLYEQTAEQAPKGNSAGVYQLIDLDGVEGFLFVANRLGEAMQADPEFSDDDHLLCHLEKTTPHADIEQLRAAAQGKYPFAPAYLDHIVHAREQRQPAAPRAQIRGQPYAQIKQRIDQTNGRGSFWGRLKHWGQEASAAVPWLRHCFHYGEPDARSFAAAALNEIDKTPELREAIDEELAKLKH